jgi:predicted phosphoribosyltransferase
VDATAFRSHALEEDWSMVFQDREDAGRQLAKRLEAFKGENPIVLGLPRGGVVVAFEVARALGVPRDVQVARKLGAPSNPELGIGAIAPGSVRVLDDYAIRVLGLHQDEIEQITAEEELELDRRLRLFRGDQPALHLTGRTVILVDDGLATGVTARAAVRSLRRQAPERLILAVPVSSPETAASLREEVDVLVVLSTPENFHAVGQFYRNFQQTSDDEVLRLLKAARRPAGSTAGALA